MDGTQIYEAPADYTHLVARGAPVRCLLPAQISARIAADHNLTTIAPVAEGTANSELLIVRKSCFLPPRFAARLLEHAMSPKDAYATVGGMIDEQPNDIQNA